MAITLSVTAENMIKNRNVFAERLNLNFFKSVSHSSYSNDTVCILSKLLSQQFDMGIQGSVYAEIIISPDFRKKGVSTEGFSPIAYKEEKKVILFDSSSRTSSTETVLASKSTSRDLYL